MNGIITAPPLVNQLACWDPRRSLPRFMYERYKGMETDIIDFYRSLYFYERWNKEEQNIAETSALADIDAKAHLDSILQTGSLSDAFNDATIIQLHNAETEGWMANIGEGDLKSVRDLIEVSLSKQIEKDPTGGTRYEYQKLLQVINVIEGMMLNAASENGGLDNATREKITRSITGMVTNPHTRSKMRESAKVVEVILQSDADKEDKLDMAAEVFHDVANSEVTFTEFREKNKGRMRKAGKTVPDLIPATIYLLSGKELIVIESTNEATTRAVESALRGLTSEFDVRDPASLISQLNDTLFTKGKYDTYLIDENELVSNRKGVKLPKPDHFHTLIVREASIAKPYIEQIAPKQSRISVFNLYRNLSPFNPIERLCAMFDVEESEENAKNIAMVISEHYKIPADISMMFKERKCHLAVWTTELSIDICLIVEREKSESVHRGSTNKE
jgi:hypothetical protein